MSKKTEYLFNLAGWILFFICALCYVYSSIEAQDPVYLAGSLTFLVACVVFAVPLIVNRKDHLR